jgi:aspartyl-tRNA(Asn)/glutamyl-tRNA(Gln) amidotransferase subunit C
VKLSPDQVRHVAKLARLEIEPKMVEKLATQLAAILGYVEQLGNVKTQDVPPTYHAIALTNVFRQDAIHPHLPRHAALANAPAQEDGAFVVPKII